MKSPTSDDTFCKDCGYPLRGLAEPRCPECGRAFDPADLRTVSVGRPLGAWQRRLLKPAGGWGVAVLSLLAAGVIAYTSRWPAGPMVRWPVLREELRLAKESAVALPWPYVARPRALMIAGVGLWVICLLAITSHVLMRWLLVPRAARRGNVRATPTRLARLCMLLAVSASVVWGGFGWRYRLAARWVQSQEHLPAKGAITRSNSSVPPPGELTFDERLPVLLTGARDLPTARQRAVALKLLADTLGERAMPAVLELAARERDAALRANEIHLASLGRDPPADISRLIGFLEHADASARAAAADGVAALRTTELAPSPPTFQVKRPEWLESTPPIFLNTSAWGWPTRNLPAPVATRLADPALRGRLERMMLNGPTRDEREAAARVLVDWPPPAYRLRVAEWGVWAERRGRLSRVAGQLAQVPPFVHQTGNALASFDPYVSYTVHLFKPVVHLTADVPLAADVQVSVHRGKPWYAYPRPDDFTVETIRAGDDEVPPALRPVDTADQQWQVDGFELPERSPLLQARDVDDASLAPLADLWEGLSWLRPHHRRYETSDTFQPRAGKPRIYGVGLHWQGLIVTPGETPPAGAALPAVPDDARFAWWSSVRRVPSSWVTGRGETERFLYYDGPTRQPSAARVFINRRGDALAFSRPYGAEAVETPPVSLRFHETFRSMPASRPSGVPDFEGLYVDVAEDGAVAAQRMVAQFDEPVAIAPGVKGRERAIATFAEMLTSYGLTRPEAQGLIDAWTAEFFQTPGRRFLLRTSAAAYARVCPMQVRPPPSEVVRLGIVWTEFGEVGTPRVPGAVRP